MSSAFSHKHVWDAIDALAQKRGLSTSGLAKLAGLDPTSFNPSKRVSKDGRERWPSTESLAKVLHATGETMDGLMGSVKKSASTLSPRDDVSLPFMQLSENDQVQFATLNPTGSSKTALTENAQWERTRFPALTDEKSFVVEVIGHYLAPKYNAGDILIVSPNAELRQNDKVLGQLNSGAKFSGKFLRKTESQIELSDFSGTQMRKIFKDDIQWIGRIMWASQ